MPLQRMGWNEVLIAYKSLSRILVFDTMEDSFLSRSLKHVAYPGMFCNESDF